MGSKYAEGMTIDQAKKFIFPFGKYKGELISDVFEVDESYVDYIYDKLKESDTLKFAIDLVCYTKHEE